MGSPGGYNHGQNSSPRNSNTALAAPPPKKAPKPSVDANGNIVIPNKVPTNYDSIWQNDGSGLSPVDKMRQMQSSHNYQSLWGTAGAPGFMYGYKAPNNPAAIDVPGLTVDARLARAKGNINVGYGFLPQLSDFGGDKKMMGAIQGSKLFGKAVSNRERIDSTIESNSGLVRDAASSANLGAAEAGARNASFRAASTGQTGSSTDIAGKRNVLGGYLTGRRNVATSALAMRSAGRNAIEQQRLGTIGSLNRNAPNDYAGYAARLDMVDQLGQAAKNAVPQAVGQGIGDLGSILANGILYQNQGMQGLNAFSLPSLSGGSSKPVGGLQTTGMGSSRWKG